MRSRTMFVAQTALLAATLAAADPGNGVGLAKGHEKQRQRIAPVELDWKRDAKAKVAKGVDKVPMAPDVPEEIRVVVTTRVAVPARPASDQVSERAARAANEMAAEAVRVWGFRAYWRAGFAQGFERAMHDPRVLEAERAEGFRYGRLDPRALLTGQQLAQQDAADQALSLAEERVRGQFTDLASTPRRDREPAFRPSVPTWAGAVFAVAPVLDAVYLSMPIASASGMSREGRAAAEGWRIEPAVLARGGSRAQAYESGWRDADRAFAVWRERQRPGSAWSRMSGADRERFRSAFVARFPEAIAALDIRLAYEGWRVGFSDGWCYGADVQGEYAYRQGYAEGFDTGVRDAAAITWPFAFRHAYAASYDSAFARWSTTAQPAVSAVRIVDANDDGVIEPGERILLEADLVNYGGAAGTFDVRAAGRTLESDASRTVTLRARSQSSLDRPLDLRVSASTPNRTDTVVRVSVGEDALDASMRVTHPLAIDDATGVSADYLGGRARVEVLVSNLSRRALDAVVRAVPLGIGGSPLADERIHVPAGRSVRAEFAAQELHPLDLIGGRAQWRVTIDRERGTDDERVVAVQEVATDLASRDLLLYMVDLAQEARPSKRDIAQARALFIDRMRADWHRACAADGNPYKRDVESGSATTALGDLARTLESERRSFESREVFDGLGDDISSFASELPGAHPLLRKWMKRLAKQIG